MRKKIIIISIIAIVVLVGAVFLISPSLDGYIMCYEKAEENDGHTIYYSREVFCDVGINNFHMSEEVIEDLFDNPKKYTSYWIRISYKNITGYPIYDVRASIPGEYENIWCDQNIFIVTVNLEGGEEKKDGVLVVIKTENMNDDEIDKLIKSIGITISARNFRPLPIYASKTIYFEK